MTPLVDVAACIRAHRFNYSSEDLLQRGIAAALEGAGFANVQREVRLTARDRIDLLVDRVGIEVKVSGSTPNVERQLRRYAAHPDIDALVLVTSTVKHLELNGTLDSVPVQVVSLAGGGL